MRNNAHAKLYEKTTLLRSEFNLPAGSDEKVVQDYRCSLSSSSSSASTSGKIYITQYGLFFFKASDKPSLRLSMRSVATVEARDKTLVVESMDGTVTAVFSGFTSIGKRDEAYALLHHFHTTPYAVRQRQIPPQEKIGEGEISHLVDIEAGARAVGKANIALETGAATLEELARQKEVIAGMRDNLYRMEDELDEANRHLRGIESIGGSLANKMTSGNKGPSHRGSRLVGARATVAFHEVREEENVVEKAVFKRPDDSLQPCVCTMDNKGLIVRDETQQQLLARLAYDDMTGVVMRARPLHCDIKLRMRFGSDRLRLCSSELQGIVNELVLRCKGKLDVSFEPNSIVFEYGDRALRKPKNDTEYGYIKNESVRRGFAIQDKQLTEIEKAANKLQLMGLDMGEELDESTQNIQALGRHTDAVGVRLSTTNERVVRLLDK